jgi:hypothetical protein
VEVSQLVGRTAIRGRYIRDNIDVWTLSLAKASGFCVTAGYYEQSLRRADNGWSILPIIPAKLAQLS